MNQQLFQSNDQEDGSLTVFANGFSEPSSALPQNTTQTEETIPRGSTLLERIRAQREREAAMETSTNEGYFPPLADGGEGSSMIGLHSMNSEENFSNDATRGLLTGTTNAMHDEYSMKSYFLTFVMDMYTLFRSLPILVQIILLVVMVYLTWILI